MNVKSFPDELYDRLRARAARNRRSVAQEVMMIIEEAVETDRGVLERLQLAGEVTLPDAAPSGAWKPRGIGLHRHVVTEILNDVRADRA